MGQPAVPMAERMRPKMLDEIIGQEHLTGTGSVLRNMLEQGNIPSMVLWGPPGTGKTTLAQVIANELNRTFFTLSAISSGVKEVRKVIDTASRMEGVILFIDEIHRFNKGQQDALLGAVEKGIITLIGATTENPSFEVNNALLSRCQVYVLHHLNEDALGTLLKSAQNNDGWLSEKKVIVQETGALFKLSGGDARKLLNLFELVVKTLDKSGQDGASIQVTDEAVLKTAQQQVPLYDKGGEQHYDII